MLQQRINELNSAIINIKGDFVYTIGFNDSKNLYTYLNNEKKNWSSTGRYSKENLEFHNIKTNALMIVLENDEEITRYLYKKVKTGTLVYENKDNISGKATAIFEIRQEIYNSTWNFRISEQSFHFISWNEMKSYIKNAFNYNIGEVNQMNNMLIIDIETGGFQVEDGIYEVAVLAIEEGEIVDTLHIGEVIDEALIHLGMGAGYAEISENAKYIDEFLNFVSKYDYPFIAHNASFDRKFLLHYNWINENSVFFDSIRAIKRSHPHLFSYSMNFLRNYFELERFNNHTAKEDVMVLYEILQRAKPTNWIPLYKTDPQKFKNSAKGFLERGLVLSGESEAFKGKQIVFTGASQFPRVLMQEIARKCGAIVSKTVNKYTDILICGEKVGPKKIQKALELDIPMHEDTWFIDIVFQDLQIEEKEYKQPLEPKPRPYLILEEFKGKRVNIGCLKLRIQAIVRELLIEMGAIPLGSSATKNVDFMIYTDNGDYTLLKHVDELGIKAIPVSKFNKMVLEENNILSI